MLKDEYKKFLTKKRKTLVKKQTIFGVVFILVGLVVVFLFIYLRSQKNAFELHGRFGITIDAGGSGTRLSIYEYKKGKLHNENYICENKGLTNSQLLSLYDSIHKCLVEAEKRIPLLINSKTPIYFAATAGMRLLKINNETAYQNIWNVVRHALNNSSFIVKLNETLLGSKEAAYSWASVNSLLDRKKSSGLFEMGSTSVQLAFEPQSSETFLPSSHTENVVLKKKSYNLYVYSFLCFGKDEFRRRYIARIIKKSGYSSNVKDPCHPLGYKKVIASNEIWNSTCVNGLYAQTVLGESFVKKNRSHFYVLHGSSNFTDCFNEVENMFYANCSHKFCDMNNVHYPASDAFFTAIGGGVYFSSKYLNLSNPVRIQAYKNATENLCSLNYTQLSSNKEFNDYTIDYCLVDVFTYFIFHELLKLNDSNKVMFANKIDNNVVSWTMGLILNKLHELSPANHYISRRLSNVTFYSAITASLVVIIIGLIAVICYYYKLRKTSYTLETQS
ncbi:ectonucleoside triphosphate diphosphohydrolase 1 isoform X2 [Hydra vulgaris]|uniref:Ectonucleoside triphosphate diphosphohydrolase 1 isoform X2 n=1 Tax=Hydra vulgaris TaxID=6087 RepID=A0ABM4CH33_HYDVU